MIEQEIRRVRTKLELIRFRRWLIVAVTLIGAILGYLISACFVVPRYTAENQLYFSAYSRDEKKTISDRQLEDSGDLAESYSAYMKEKFLLERAEEQQPSELSHHYTVDELERAIDILADVDTSVIYFYVTTKDPLDSKLICDFYSEFSMREIVALTGVGSYEIFNETKLPEKPSFPNPFLFSFVGATLAFVIVLLCCINMQQKIYEEKDIRMLIPKSVIVAGVPRLK